MSRRRIRFLLVALAVIIAVCTAAYLLLKDESPPNLDDLKPVRLEIPDDQNAMTWFIKAAEIKTYDPWEPDRPETNWVDVMQGDKPFDAKLAADVIDGNAEMLKLVRQGILCEKSQAPEPDPADPFGRVGNLATMRQAARMMALRAVQLSHQGQQKEALAECMDICRYGRLIQESRSPMIEFLVGMAIEQTGTARLGHILAGDQVECDTLKGYIKVLDRCRPTREAITQTLKSEFRITCNQIDKIRSMKEPLPLDGGGRLYRSAYSYKPNESKRLLAEALRKRLADIPPTFARFTRLSLPREPLLSAGSAFGALLWDAPEPPPLTWIQKMQIRLKRNALGKLTYIGAAGATDGLIRETYGIHCWLTGTQILIALKCHKLKTGSLPKSLDELVPEYFDKVPVDPLDGKPFRYLPEKNVVYSVGQDLKDDGGAELREGEGTARDQVFKIEF